MLLLDYQVHMVGPVFFRREFHYYQTVSVLSVSLGDVLDWLWKVWVLGLRMKEDWTAGDSVNRPFIEATYSSVVMIRILRGAIPPLQ